MRQIGNIVLYDWRPPLLSGLHTSFGFNSLLSTKFGSRVMYVQYLFTILYKLSNIFLKKQYITLGGRNVYCGSIYLLNTATVEDHNKLYYCKYVTITFYNICRSISKTFDSQGRWLKNGVELNTGLLLHISNLVKEKCIIHNKKLTYCENLCNESNN